MKCLRIGMLLLGVLLFMQGLCASGQVLKLNNNQIIEMTRYASEDTILAMIKGADADYRLEPDDMVKLKNAGVSNRVIQAMIDRMAKGNSPHQPTVPEPEREGIIYLFNETNNQMQPLSKETGVMRGKAKLLGFAGAKTVVDLNGAHSPTQLNASDHFVFLIRVQGGVGALQYMPEDTDFSAFVGPLHAFASNKDKRERTAYNVTYYGLWAKNTSRVGSDASATVTRAAGNILKITVTSLPAGEYGFNVT